MSSTTQNVSANCASGIDGLDYVLCGGFPRNRFYLIEGDPGVGKTTLALQFLMEGVKEGEKVLYITLSETKEELLAVAASHGWDLNNIEVFELSAMEQRQVAAGHTTLFHPSEIELKDTIKVLLDEVERVNPTRLVLDSLSEIRLLAQEPLRYRREMLTLKQFFAGRRCTVLLLDDRTSERGDLQIHSISHGVVSMEQLAPEYGVERRRFKVMKLRGVRFHGGYHDYIIRRGGLIVFPRLVAADFGGSHTGGELSSGIAKFDEIIGGGLSHGTSNLFMGPAGTGKSTLALQVAVSAAQAGKTSIYYSFDENLSTLRHRAGKVGLPLAEYERSGNVILRQVDPAEISPGEMAFALREQVEEKSAAVVVIDSLNGLIHAMPEEHFMLLQLHELFTYLAQRGVVTIACLTQHGVIGSTITPVDLTYLSDTVVQFRYYENDGMLRQAISVVKKRTGDHDKGIHNFEVTSNGLVVGPPLKGFRGILTGNPETLSTSVVAKE